MKRFLLTTFLALCIVVLALLLFQQGQYSNGERWLPQPFPADSSENQAGSKQGTAERVEKAARERFRNVKAYISPGRHGVEGHIRNRHWYNARFDTGTSYFEPTMTMQKLQSIATETLNKGDKRIGRNGRMIHQYRFSWPIGIASNGKPAYSLRVVTEPEVERDQTVRVITAFPVR